MLETCLQALKRSRLRQTSTRKVLLGILHAAKAPLSLPDILIRCHRAGRRAHKTTLYRDLETLEQLGILRRVVVSDRKQYFELTERGHHHHLVCTECDAIRDISLPDSSLLHQAQRVSDDLGFAITSHSLEFFGRCGACLRQPKTAAE